MATNKPDPFLRILQGLVRPLARMLITRGVSAPVFYRMMKRVYVEVARDEFGLDGAEPTQSRISLLTGVHRRDVHDILADDSETWETARRRSATVATVLGQWTARQDYLDGDGLPRRLPRTAPTGPSFEALVRDINRDIRPRTILDELLRQNLVTQSEEDGMLEIAGDAVAGPGAPDQRAIFFAANVGDHLAAAADNLTSEEPRFLERAVFYNRLTADSVDQIEEAARGASQTLLETINRDSQPLQEADKTKEGNTHRYRLGVYFYREDRGPSDDGGREGK